MKTTMILSKRFNYMFIGNQIQDMIKDYYERYLTRPTILVIGPIYLNFLRSYVLKTTLSSAGDMKEFHGLKIVETMKDTCEVF